MGTLTDVTERKKRRWNCLSRISGWPCSLKAGDGRAARSGDRSRSQEPADICKRILQLMKAEYPDRKDYFDIISQRLNESILCSENCLCWPNRTRFNLKDQINSVLQQVATLLETNAVLSHIKIEKRFSTGRSGK
ncbi:hypothetical protein PO124_06340 [Bacillus licheniformis]|nr:hypothetical protein [Bacillus licheniformis]